MIGHDTITSDDTGIRCECGFMLGGFPMGSSTWKSEPDAGSFQEQVMNAHQDHLTELAAKRLYGFPGDEYLQESPEAVYELWVDDHGYDPPHMMFPEASRPAKLEIECFTVAPALGLITSAARIIDWIEEDTADDLGFPEAYDALVKACKTDKVQAAAEKLRETIAAEFGPKWSMADTLERIHVVTWDENHAPLLDGEPMYVTRPTTP